MISHYMCLLYRFHILLTCVSAMFNEETRERGKVNIRERRKERKKGDEWTYERNYSSLNLNWICHMCNFNTSRRSWQQIESALIFILFVRVLPFSEWPWAVQHLHPWSATSAIYLHLEERNMYTEGWETVDTSFSKSLCSKRLYFVFACIFFPLLSYAALVLLESVS
jgi:hypothetical protein